MKTQKELLLEEILRFPRYRAVSANHPTLGAIKECDDGFLIKVEDIRELLNNVIAIKEL